MLFGLHASMSAASPIATFVPGTAVKVLRWRRPMAELPKMRFIRPQ